MPSKSWYLSQPGIRTRWTVDHVDGSQSDPIVDVVPIVYEDFGSKQWVNTPGWKSIPSVRANPPMNRYSYARYIRQWINDGIDDRTEYKFNGAEHRTYFDRGAIPNDLTGWDTPRPSSAEKTAVEDEATTRVRNEVKDQKVNVAQAAAESRQTVVLFENTVRRVVDTIVWIKSGNWNRAAREVGIAPNARKHRKHLKRMKQDPDAAVSSAWLELQYGWRPLLSDLYGAAELIAQKHIKEERTRARKSASVSGNYREYTQTRLCTKVGNGIWKYTVVYTLYYATSDSGYKTATQVGVTNPALVAWELVPWSFVIDWFIPVGNWISSWDATYGLHFDKGTKTTIYEYNFSASKSGGREVYGPGNWAEWVNAGTVNYKVVEIERYPLSGWPPVSRPHFKDPFSAEHIANATALLNQLLKR